MTMRITENHSFSKKVNQLYDLMTELGITIESSYDGIRIIDTEINRSYTIREVGSGQVEPQFPTACEFKLTYEDDNY